MNFAFKQLTDADVLDALTIYISNEDYFMQTSGEFPSEDLLENDRFLVPDEVDEEAKYYEIVYQNKEPIAILDFIVGYPDEETIYIGLLLIDAEFQGKGVGEAIIEQFMARWQHAPISKIRLGVLENNPRAEQFWQRLGFEHVEKKQATYGEHTHQVHILERPLA